MNRKNKQSSRLPYWELQLKWVAKKVKGNNFISFVCMATWLSVGGFACSPKVAQARPRIITGIPPLLYFVKALVGKDVATQSFLAPGSSPVSFAPPPSHLRAFEHARLFLLAGVPMERAYVPRLKNNFPGLKIVGLQRHIPGNLLLESEDPRGIHNKESHALLHRDPHFWLSPQIMLLLLPKISKEIQGVFPRKINEIKLNERHLYKRVWKLHKKLRGHRLFGHYFVVQHPSWRYFARDYGLRMLSIEEEGVESNPANFRKVLQVMKAHHIRRIIVQPEFAHSAAKTLATELGAKLVFLSPLGEDWEGILLCLSRSIRNMECR